MGSKRIAGLPPRRQRQPLPAKRLRTNRKLIAAELKHLSDLSAERRGNPLSRTAMCLGAAYALGWILGESDKPTAQILTALERKEP